MSLFHALVPCAGSGMRAGSELPKQYRLLAGRPMVMHTLQALSLVPQLASGWVVVSPDDDFVWPVQHWPLQFRRIHCGGSSRAASVFNGLLAMLEAGVDPQDWVLVHDAARCLVSPAEVGHLIEVCRDDPVGGLLALPLPDTLKSESAGRVSQTIAREHKWLAQTPQMFRLQVLCDALAATAQMDFEGITDEASAIERLGLQPRLVQGSARNVKVTYPADLELAEAILRSRA
ncbi:MAG: 2-C-methyl-D-erythritol 4-phosphate cytidylyltransferase [Limnohabitans sp.]